MRAAARGPAKFIFVRLRKSVDLVGSEWLHLLGRAEDLNASRPGEGFVVGAPTPRFKITNATNYRDFTSEHLTEKI